MDAGTPLVPSVQATNPNGISRIPTLGELVMTSVGFTVPQNPLLGQSSMNITQSSPGMGNCGCGCGGGCGCNGANFYGLQGFTSDLSAGNYSALPGDLGTWFGGSTTVFGMDISNAVIAGGVAVAVAMLVLPGGKTSSRTPYVRKSRGYR